MKAYLFSFPPNSTICRIKRMLTFYRHFSQHILSQQTQFNFDMEKSQQLFSIRSTYQADIECILPVTD